MDIRYVCQTTGDTLLVSDGKRSTLANLIRQMEHAGFSGSERLDYVRSITVELSYYEFQQKADEFNIYLK